MISGYNEFPNDVNFVFADVIQRYGFRMTTSTPDAVALLNNNIQIGFSINEEILNMSIKSGEEFYNVTDIVPLIDKEFYKKWVREREADLKGLGRKEYYKTYLFFYHQLSEKYLLNMYRTGIIPFPSDMEITKKINVENDKNFSVAWKAMQQLDYSNPIRQKYIANDPTWINDILKSLDKK